MLALLLTTLVLTSRVASAGQEGEAAPGHIVVAAATQPAVGPLAVATSGGRAVLPAAAPNDSFCLTCHADPTLQTHFADGAALSLHVDARAVRDSAHGQLGCVTCHADRETCPSPPIAVSGPAGYEARAAGICVRCHLSAAGDYAESVHGAPVLSGAGDGATCNDCHSANGSGHSTTRVSDLPAARMTLSVAENCGRCHSDALASYRNTAHGELVQFADNGRGATCTDCHGIHAVRAVDDPMGPLAPARLALVCQGCHRGADAQFAGRWLGHEASTSPSGFADYAHRGVVTLMVVGVCFGLTHVTLDFLRSPRRPGSGSR